jgi:hypothetical protein
MCYLVPWNEVWIMKVLWCLNIMPFYRNPCPIRCKKTNKRWILCNLNLIQSWDSSCFHHGLTTNKTLIRGIVFFINILWVMQPQICQWFWWKLNSLTMLKYGDLGYTP